MPTHRASTNPVRIPHPTDFVASVIAQTLLLLLGEVLIVISPMAWVLSLPLLLPGIYLTPRSVILLKREVRGWEFNKKTMQDAAPPGWFLGVLLTMGLIFFGIAGLQGYWLVMSSRREGWEFGWWDAWCVGSGFLHVYLASWLFMFRKEDAPPHP